MSRIRTRSWMPLTALCLALCTTFACAQMRDPTLAPSDSGVGQATPDPKTGKPERLAMSVLVRDGQRFLMVGTRLYARGQTLGQARIEHISETEVSLREGGVLRKVALFQGVQRRAVGVGADCSVVPAPQAAKPLKKSRAARTADAPQTPPASAACAPVQP